MLNLRCEWIRDNELLTAVHGLTIMLDNSLDLRRVETGQYKAHRRSVNLNTWLTRTCNSLQPLFKTRNMTLVHRKVEVRAQGNAREFSIEIQDEGPGLGSDPEALFKLFHRGSAASPMGQKSAGFGLFIARQAVALHGGRLTGANAPDGGAVFTITIPPAVVYTQPNS